MRKLFIVIILILSSAISAQSRIYRMYSAHYGDGSFRQTWYWWDENGTFGYQTELRSVTGAFIRGKTGFGVNGIVIDEWKSGPFNYKISTDGKEKQEDNLILSHNNHKLRLILGERSEPMKLYITKINGQTTYEGTIHDNDIIDISALCTGAYIITCIYKANIYSRLIIIGG